MSFAPVYLYDRYDVRFYPEDSAFICTSSFQELHKHYYWLDKFEKWWLKDLQLCEELYLVLNQRYLNGKKIHVLAEMWNPFDDEYPLWMRIIIKTNEDLISCIALLRKYYHQLILQVKKGNEIRVRDIVLSISVLVVEIRKIYLLVVKTYM